MRPVALFSTSLFISITFMVSTACRIQIHLFSTHLPLELQMLVFYPHLNTCHRLLSFAKLN